MVSSVRSDVFFFAASSKFRGCPPQFTLSRSFACYQFLGQSNQKKNRSVGCWSRESPQKVFVDANVAYYVSRSANWWENHLKPNMMDIQSPQELVDTLKNAGDRLVIVGFYSPTCAGCRALHPKIGQLAESNPDVLFLKVNYEKLKKMCIALNIPVLPFFKLYKGSHGLICSFSCTLSTIKKFRQALAKYKNEVQPSHAGLAKGLNESELMNLESVGEISMNRDTQIPSTSVKRLGVVNYFFKRQMESYPDELNRGTFRKLKTTIMCWLHSFCQISTRFIIT